MPAARPQPLTDETLLARAIELIREIGPARAAEILGISRFTATRLLAGLAPARGTLSSLRLAHMKGSI